MEPLRAAFFPCWHVGASTGFGYIACLPLLRLRRPSNRRGGGVFPSGDVRSTFSTLDWTVYGTSGRRAGQDRATHVRTERSRIPPAHAAVARRTDRVVFDRGVRFWPEENRRLFFFGIERIMLPTYRQCCPRKAGNRTIRRRDREQPKMPNKQGEIKGRL